MQVETDKHPTADDAIVEVKIIEADAFGNEKTVWCSDSNAFGVSATGALLVGVIVADDQGGELHPIHAWAPDRWVKADVEVVVLKSEGEKVDAAEDVTP